MVYELWKKCKKWVNLDEFECEFGLSMKISQFWFQILIYYVIKWSVNDKCDEAKQIWSFFLSFMHKILTFYWLFETNGVWLNEKWNELKIMNGIWCM